MFERGSGILMHISSLPGKYGIGDFGEAAYKFVDFLSYSNQKLWQILPLGPIGYGNSPYQSVSSFAGNYLFIDIDDLVNKGYISLDMITSLKKEYDLKITDYMSASYFKKKILDAAFKKFISDKGSKSEYDEFKNSKRNWLRDYGMYMALKEYFGNRSWSNWPKGYKYHKEQYLREMTENMCEKAEYYYFEQYIFDLQWKKLKKYANEKGIKIVGDIPIFVSVDSADAWSCKKIFMFDKYGRPQKVAGCPPDYFSKTGQLWGNILYNWKELQKRKYTWWIDRIKRCFELYDVVRIDHFRGFDAFWSIPAKDKTAQYGRWEKGPGIRFFETIKHKLGDLAIVAEDLGVMTDSVRKLLKETDFPGMKVMQFAFDYVDSEYLPDKYPENCVAYTGTHDNETMVGWYNGSPEWRKQRCDSYLRDIMKINSELPINFRSIEAIWKSKAVVSIAPMQDLLGCDNDCRMNEPSTVGHNWDWRMKEGSITQELTEYLKEVTQKYNR